VLVFLSRAWAEIIPASADRDNARAVIATLPVSFSFGLADGCGWVYVCMGMMCRSQHGAN
jgi:hypothetical protein